jgi:hypothetical protein
MQELCEKSAEEFIYSVYGDGGRSLYFSKKEALANYLETLAPGTSVFIELISEREYRSRIFLQLYTSHDIMVPGL